MFGFIITKKSISSAFVLIVLLVFLLVLVAFKTSSDKPQERLQPATERVERIAFIENMGYKVNQKQEEMVKEIEIPNIFNGVYAEYQKIQQQAGYNLEKYAGSKAIIYTYNLIYPERTDVYAHLIVVDGFVIGGDISALSVEDGFINPLARAFNLESALNDHF